MSQPTLRIEMRSRAGLRRYEVNSKTHPAAQVEAIKTSIERFGFNDPIGVTEDGLIVEGEGRFLAAGLLEMDEVPVLVLPQMTDEQVRLYRIAHNKIALSSTFDFAALVEQLRDLAADTASLGEMGFSQDAANNLFQMFSADGADGPALTVADPVQPESLDAEVVWESKEQRASWTGFTKALSEAHEDKTLGAALVRHFNRAMSGHIIPLTLATPAGKTEEHQGW